MSTESSLTFAFEQNASPVPVNERAALLENPGFGRIFTDHMVTIRYKEGQGWHNARVHPRGPLLMDPAAMTAAIAAAGGPTTASELGLPRKLWRDAMKYARDVRNRWSFLDLADDAGLLDEFLDRDEQ